MALRRLKKILAPRWDLPPNWEERGRFYCIRIHTEWGSTCRICRRENVRVKVGVEYFFFCPDCDVEDGMWTHYPICENCKGARLVVDSYGEESIFCLKCGAYLGKMASPGVEYSLRLL